ncbi:hypothetical protein PHYSODRAFT_476744, partial [Phytophthora sojae]
WIAVLRHKLPQTSYKKVLVQLPDGIMPHLTKTRCCSPTSLYQVSIGAVTSLLALNSLFILTTSTRPTSTTSCMRCWTTTLYSAKQRGRFFGLLNLFLSPTHLPAYTVAAFAKRLSRSALMVEPGAILFIIPMVYKLNLRHMECL